MSLVDLKIDPATGDLDLTDNQLRLTANIQEAVQQKLLITLRTFRGEWNFNTLFGVPYLENENNNETILGKVSKTFFDTNIRAAILSVEGMQSLTSYSSVLDRVTGIITVDFSGITDSGEVVSLAVTA